MNKLIQKKNALPKLIDAQSGFLASQSAQVMLHSNCERSIIDNTPGVGSPMAETREGTR